MNCPNCGEPLGGSMHSCHILPGRVGYSPDYKSEKPVEPIGTLHIVPERPKTGRTIFLLTCMGVEWDKEKIIRTRTWGWFSRLDEAEHAALTNDTDMYEDGYYNVVVIEEVEEGTMAMACAEHWYEAVIDIACKGGYRVTKMDKPSFLEGSVNFGIG